MLAELGEAELPRQPREPVLDVSDLARGLGLRAFADGQDTAGHSALAN